MKAAVTGELTRAWREKHKSQLESGEALLVRILKARREAWETAELAKMKAKGQKPANDSWKSKYVEPTPPDISKLQSLPFGWVWVTIDHIAQCLDYARVPVSAVIREKDPGSTPYYGANGQVGTINGHLFDEELVLVVEDETFTGRTKPFSYKIQGKSWVNNHAHVLRAIPVVCTDFLNALLMRYPFIPLTTGTTARRKLTQKSLMAAPIAIPSLEEQEEILSRIDENISQVQPYEGSEAGLGISIASLRQAVLREAFSGRLIAQVPTDEPAFILLERIAAERAVVSNNKKKPAPKSPRTKKAKT